MKTLLSRRVKKETLIPKLGTAKEFYRVQCHEKVNAALKYGDVGKTDGKTRYVTSTAFQDDNDWSEF